MSTLYVTADELIVFMIAISVALVPMILWIGRRASQIQLETTSNQQGPPNTPRTGSVGPDVGHGLTMRLNPFRSARTVSPDALNLGSRGGSDEARRGTVARLPRPTPHEPTLSDVEAEQINTQLDMMLRAAGGGGGAR